MMRFKLALIVIGGVLAFFGVQEVRLRSATDDQPQSISCADLEANGPGDNAHIVLTDFLLSDSFVYEEKNGKWNKVWVPAVPLGGEYHQSLLALADDQGNLPANLPPPTNVSIIVKSSDVKGEGDIQTLANLESLQGVIVNKIESLGSKEEKILRDSYPGVNFDTCWILEVGRKPASMLKMAGLCVGGIALIAVGGVLFLVGGGGEEE